MTCSFHFDFLLPGQFATQPRLRPSKKRDRELELVRERGQARRIVVSTYGEVLPNDIPLYEALIKGGYGSIAVVIVSDGAEPASIKAARALSMKHPLPECFCPAGKYPDPFQRYEQYLYAKRR